MTNEHPETVSGLQIIGYVLVIFALSFAGLAFLTELQVHRMPFSSPPSYHYDALAFSGCSAGVAVALACVERLTHEPPDYFRVGKWLPMLAGAFR